MARLESLAAGLAAPCRPKQSESPPPTPGVPGEERQRGPLHSGVFTVIHGFRSDLGLYLHCTATSRTVPSARSRVPLRPRREITGIKRPDEFSTPTARDAHERTAASLSSPRLLVVTVADPTLGPTVHVLRRTCPTSPRPRGTLPGSYSPPPARRERQQVALMIFQWGYLYRSVAYPSGIGLVARYHLRYLQPSVRSRRGVLC